jgi:hypothetical protein
MEIRIEPYKREHVSAVRAFNERLQTRAGSAFRVGESPQEDAPRREYVAIDGRGEVRGSFSLKRQQFWINGEMLEVGNCQLPLSEGIFDPAYANLGMVLLRHALALQPRLFCLGMGSRDHRLPRMLTAMRWTLVDIPFRFRVCHAARFMRNIMPLRQTPQRRLFLDAMAASGAGWLAVHALQKRIPISRSVEVEEVADFGEWADDLWKQCKSDLSLSLVRTSEVLNDLYAGPRYVRLKIAKGAGWVVLRDTQMQGHRYFGDLRVATIVDALALPSAIPSVVLEAARFMAMRDVDLIISNQGHEAWVRGLGESGFLSGPTNYVMAMSPALSKLATDHSRLHINRGDGDGPLDL